MVECGLYIIVNGHNKGMGCLMSACKKYSALIFIQTTCTKSSFYSACQLHSDTDCKHESEEGVEDEHAIVEPSGGESSGLIGNEEEIAAVTDESSAAPGDPQCAVLYRWWGE